MSELFTFTCIDCRGQDMQEGEKPIEGMCRSCSHRLARNRALFANRVPLKTSLSFKRSNGIMMNLAAGDKLTLNTVDGMDVEIEVLDTHTFLARHVERHPRGIGLYWLAQIGRGLTNAIDQSHWYKSKIERKARVDELLATGTVRLVRPTDANLHMLDTCWGVCQ